MDIMAQNGSKVEKAIEEIEAEIQNVSNATGYSKFSLLKGAYPNIYNNIENAATDVKGEIIANYYKNSDLTEKEFQEILEYFGF